MSLFVHPENQKIIWNIINGNPYIIRYFESKPQQAKEEWFRKSIEDFYTRIQGKEIDPNELNILNKEVLTSMIQSVHLQNPQYTAHNSTPQQPVREPVNTIPPQEPSHDPMNMMTYANTINTPTIVKDSKEDILINSFRCASKNMILCYNIKLPKR